MSLSNKKEYRGDPEGEFIWVKDVREAVKELKDILDLNRHITSLDLYEIFGKELLTE